LDSKRSSYPTASAWRAAWYKPIPSQLSEGTGAAGGEFDDQMVWIPIGVLYPKPIAAGQPP